MTAFTASTSLPPSLSVSLKSLPDFSRSGLHLPHDGHQLRPPAVAKPYVKEAIKTRIIRAWRVKRNPQRWLRPTLVAGPRRPREARLFEGFGDYEDALGMEDFAFTANFDSGETLYRDVRWFGCSWGPAYNKLIYIWKRKFNFCKMEFIYLWKKNNRALYSE